MGVLSILQDRNLSSPRAKRAGPKGLRAESARAFTGRRNSYSGRGEDFLSRQPNFFTETAVTPERKVEKWFPRWKINRHAEGLKWVIDQNWGRMAKIGFLGQKPKFWAQKKAYTFGDSPCSGHDRKKLFKEKKCLCQNNQGGKCHFGRFFGVRPIFRPKTTFRPNVKTPKMTFSPLIIWAKPM